MSNFNSSGFGLWSSPFFPQFARIDSRCNISAFVAPAAQLAPTKNR